MNNRVWLLVAGAVLFGLGAGVLGTRALRTDADAEVLKELRTTRAMLADLAKRDSTTRPSPALTTIIYGGATPDGAGAPVTPAAAPAAAHAEAEPQATPANWAAFDAGNKIVSAAFVNGRWSKSDERELLSLAPQMAKGQYVELRKSVAAAVNADKLILEDDGRP